VFNIWELSHTLAKQKLLQNPDRNQRPDQQVHRNC